MFTEEIKKSRFITLLQHTDGVDEAKQFIQSVKDEYPDARHHCWAFVAGVRMILSNWDFLMTVSRPEQPVNR